MKVINLFGGPGAGKSTTAAGVFSILKLQGVNCELVTEYAKDLTWEERHKTLTDQDYVFANQYHRLHRLIGKVEVIVTDSPLLIGVVFGRMFGTMCETLEDHIKFRNSEFDNINVLLRRVKPYNPSGRNQTESESLNIDRFVKGILYEEALDHCEIDGDSFAPAKVAKIYLGTFPKYAISEILQETL